MKELQAKQNKKGKQFMNIYQTDPSTQKMIQNYK